MARHSSWSSWLLVLAVALLAGFDLPGEGPGRLAAALLGCRLVQDGCQALPAAVWLARAGSLWILGSRGGLACGSRLAAAQLPPSARGAAHGASVWTPGGYLNLAASPQSAGYTACPCLESWTFRHLRTFAAAAQLLPRQRGREAGARLAGASSWAREAGGMGRGRGGCLLEAGRGCHTACAAMRPRP